MNADNIMGWRDDPVGNDGTTERERVMEKFVDAYGIGEVLNALTNVCAYKAEHVAENWQDEELAKRWDVVARAIVRIVPKARGL